MKEILYVLLDNYADHEMPFLAMAVTTNEQGFREFPKYVNKILAPSLEAVKSVGGCRMLPDYSFDSMPDDFAAIVLVGGYGWQSPVTEKLVPVVKSALERGVAVGAICNAASWMAKQGFLNNVKHTGNGIDQLKLWGGDMYTNEAGFVCQQAVRDGNLVTANGSGQLEFACELLNLIENDSPEMIARYGYFYKHGLTELMAPKPRFEFNTIGLFTNDNKKMVDFYRNVFGFQTDWNGIEPNVEMRLGNMRLIMFPRIAFERMTSNKYGYPKGDNGTMELSFDVPSFPDVDREYAHAIALGAKPVFAPNTEPWGQRTCYVADPDGNLIEISSFNA